MKRKRGSVVTMDDVRTMMADRSGDPGQMRPYVKKNGKMVMAVYIGGDPKLKSSFREVPVTNAQLRYDEWRTLDDAVIQVAEQRLVGFDDLRRNGLVHPLANAMGTTVLTWEEMSDAMEALVSIDPVRRTNNDAVDFAAKHIPIPIVHADYQISKRVLEESRNKGNGIDTINAERAAHKVAVKLEDMLFGSTSLLTYGGGTIYTYLTHPDINTLSFDSAGDYWDDAGKTAAQIKDDVNNMKKASIADLHYGPWMLYIPTDYETVMDDDYSVSGGSVLTIRERLLKIGGIQGIAVVDRLAADTVLLVQMRKDTVDLIDGMPLQNVMWSTEGGMIQHNKVMTIQVPRVKSEYNNRSGIVKLA